MTRRSAPADPLRGAALLAVDATTRVVDLVEAMHREIGGGPHVLARPFLRPTVLFSAPVYAAVRAVTRLSGAGADVVLAALAPLLGSCGLRLDHPTAVAVLNGVVGDYLAEKGNPLAIAMALRRGGEALVLERSALQRAIPQPTRKLLVFVHGSCRHDGQWARPGGVDVCTVGEALGFTVLHLHYNSGLHICANGREFAALLERLVAAWPTAVEELAIVGHSMGGLVSRSACHVGELEDHAWRRRLTKLICVASPHHGAPLERGGHWIDVLLGVSRYSAPLARLGMLRSAGVTDLRFGNVLDEHRDPRGRFACGRDVRRRLRLPAGVRCYAIAGTRSPRASGRRLAGDGLVPVDSALGRHRDPELTLPFDATWIGFGMGHVALLHRPEVHAVIRSWLSS